MPLAFESISHGTIAFGFFNIDSDMLLLDRYFFFAPEFCRSVSALNRNKEAGSPVLIKGFFIEKAADIGDLMGAIHGVRFAGFIGEAYKRFPFPERPEDFKQKPEGARNRQVMEEIIKRYSDQLDIPLSAGDEETARIISAGIYRFTKQQFQELLRYVWRGGYPRWKGGVRPDYVTGMKKDLDSSDAGLFTVTDWG